MATNDPGTGAGADAAKVSEVLQTETGGRALQGPAAVLLFIIPVCWSLFQLWIASPLPFILNFGIFNSTEARSIHLAFAVFLAFSAFPMIKGVHANKVPVYDWVLALAAAFAASYLYVFYDQLATRPGAPITADLWVALFGLVLLLEATRRALGLPLTIVAAVFIGYSLAGPYMPDVISHKGVSLNKLASHQWLGTEGVFGVALGVSTSFVFLFVLFGALLERAGAGNYFIKVAYAMLGHMKGGPAKAAVVSSGLSGVISGSSIANVVTTGTFTIPLMKRVGFPATKAGAVEVAASTNGQLTPPIMGAAAFLMVEYVGISYLEVIKHAILPALISYVALVYIVHLEACKLKMHGIERPNRPSLAQRMLNWVVVLIGLIVLTFAVYYGVGWTKGVLGEAAPWVLGPILVAIYVALIGYATRFPELEEDDPDKAMDELPEVGPTVKTGLYYLLPVVVLVWCLTVERFSPQLSAFWATLFMVFIVITQRPLKAFFRKHGGFMDEFTGGIGDLFHSLATGARNMVGIGVATATAGIVVGTVTLTGIGLVMTQFVEFLSGGNLLLMLMLTAVISLILGMGLPTTANYIVVSALMAPVIVMLGQQNGLIVPLIAVHLFVFYFGIMADVTPPVGLASFAAAAVSGGDPIRTGFQAFYYSLRTAALPFLFIFNTDLLLIDVGWLQGIVVFVIATIAMLIFAAGTQGFFLVRNRWYESLLLLLVAFTLFRPGFWMDRIHDPYESVPPADFAQALAQVDHGSQLRVQIAGEDAFGDSITTYYLVPVPRGETGEERMERLGLELWVDGDQTLVDMVEFGSLAAEIGFDFDQEIIEVLAPVDRWAKELMWIPGFLLFGLVVLLQRRRQRTEQASSHAV